MFSFIRKFFENRRLKAAIRDRLCDDLIQRVTRALVDYADVDHGNIDSVRQWITDNKSFLDELDDIRKFKKSPQYLLLERQKKNFIKFWGEANVSIRVLTQREKQKRADAEYVSEKLNQWVSDNKRQKLNGSKQKGGNRKIEKIAHRSDTPSFDGIECTCCGKDGKKKRLYPTENDAWLVAEKRSKVIGIPLRIYPCPDANGFHITSTMSRLHS